MYNLRVLFYKFILKINEICLYSFNYDTSTSWRPLLRNAISSQQQQQQTSMNYYSVEKSDEQTNSYTHNNNASNT